MAGDPVGWGHDTRPPRSEGHELFAELFELIARVDGIPDAVLEAARAAGPAPPGAGRSGTAPCSGCPSGRDGAAARDAAP